MDMHIWIFIYGYPYIWFRHGLVNTSPASQAAIAGTATRPLVPAWQSGQCCLSTQGSRGCCLSTQGSRGLIHVEKFAHLELLAALLELSAASLPRCRYCCLRPMGPKGNLIPLFHPRWVPLRASELKHTGTLLGPLLLPLSAGPQG